MAVFKSAGSGTTAIWLFSGFAAGAGMSCSAVTIIELLKGIIICDWFGVCWPDMQSHGKTAAMQTAADPMAALAIKDFFNITELFIYISFLPAFI